MSLASGTAQALSRPAPSTAAAGLRETMEISNLIGEAYALIRGVVEKAQKTGEFRSEIPSEFAVMAFYGAIEQVLTGWIFGLLEEGDGAYDRAKTHVVETICGGLAA